MSNIILHKMNGLGNKFLIFDARLIDGVTLSGTEIQKLSANDNPFTGGCDQFITLRESKKASLFMQINNQDGGEVDACGNASRCIAWYEKNIRSNESNDISIETNTDILEAVTVDGDNFVSVKMPAPIFEWDKIPLAQNVDDVLNLPVEFQSIKGGAVSMGNPHIVFIIDGPINELDLNSIGKKYETHSFFPKKVNVSFANVVDSKNIDLRVFERGVGETSACGTGACATHVIARSKGLVDSKSNVHLKGGTLEINWSGDTSKNERVIMTGETEYNGALELIVEPN